MEIVARVCSRRVWWGGLRIHLIILHVKGYKKSSSLYACIEFAWESENMGEQTKPEGENVIELAAISKKDLDKNLSFRSHSSKIRFSILPAGI